MWFKMKSNFAVQLEHRHSCFFCVLISVSSSAWSIRVRLSRSAASIVAQKSCSDEWSSFHAGSFPGRTLRSAPADGVDVDA